MKKFLKFVALIISSVLLTSCSLKTSLSSNTGTENPADYNYNPKSELKQKMFEILSCFDERNSNKLKKMFSKSKCDNADLDNQIKDAFNFYEGVSKDHEPFYCAESNTCFNKDHYESRSFRCELEKIKTDKNRCYNIVAYYVLVDEKNKDMVGFSSIILEECQESESDNYYKIG